MAWDLRVPDVRGDESQEPDGEHRLDPEASRQVLRDPGPEDRAPGGHGEGDPGAKGAVAKDLLDVQRQEVEVREDDPAQEQAADVGTRHRVDPEDSERH